MKSNAERMNLVFARAKKIKHCRETKKLNFCKVATALLSVLLLCCTALFPTSYKSAAVAGYCGAILLIDGMCALNPHKRLYIQGSRWRTIFKSSVTVKRLI